MGEARKAERQAARAARAAFVASLDALARNALEDALARLLLPHLGAPGVLGSYAASGDEIDPQAIEQAAEAQGWRLAFPRVAGAGPLGFHAARFPELVAGFRGIAEPPPGAATVRPDVLLVPLVAADLRGNRLGQGGGHYDRTLASLRASGRILAIGLAWDVQLAAAVAAEAWDQPLDAIATPSAFHLAGAGARRMP